MSLFDTISNTVSSLFDGDISGAIGNFSSDSSGGGWLGALGGIAKGINASNEAGAKKQNQEDYLYRFLERNAATQPINQTFSNHSRSVPYGASKFSADPQEIQREWSSYLQGVGNYTPVVPGEKFSKGAI